MKVIEPSFLKKIFHDQWRIVLILALFNMLFEYLFAWVFFESEASSFVANYLKFLPPIVTKLMGVQAGTEYFTSQMLAFGYEHPIILLTLAFIPVNLNARYLSGEIERGTINLFLTRPVHRIAIPISIMIFIIVAEGIILTMLYLGTVIGYYHFELGINLSDYWRASLTFYFLILGLAAACMWVAVNTSERGVALSRSIGLIVFFYFFDTIIRLNDSLTFLLKFSYFNLYKPGEIVLGRSSYTQSILVISIIAMVFFSLSLIKFNRRDM